MGPGAAAKCGVQVVVIARRGLFPGPPVRSLSVDVDQDFGVHEAGYHVQGDNDRCGRGAWGC